ncbi:flippase-like domain-containing protein [Gloeocapsopsis crepidinum LEGE 06123]|uniref:Flippase-like domain-containing protein n=1 Tax=Gloeocapsopsis crepidinum LEGE 06123 TaxID=588587 RepID=A0ABR9UU11_9CHRO|nr:lysylphosphatidylglycerol synthase transmembrane domain-containing protein [Gloeocapsopsis crepidinum]MBE9191771.1 flippase-like domain-containing protein [Gloeocapsopsis crepidinum LEGE 06123]
MIYSLVRSKKVWSVFFTVCLIVLLGSILKPSDIFSALSQVGLEGVTKLFFLVGITQILRALRFFELLSVKTSIPFFLIFQITCIYQFLNHILPVRSGELSLPLLLKRYSNYPYISSVASLLLTRIHDALALASIVSIGVGVAVLQGRIASLWLSSLVLSLVAIALVIGLFIFMTKNQQLARTSRKRVTAYKGINNFFIKVNNLIKTFYNELLIYRQLSLHLKLFSYSILLWLAIFILFWVVLQSLGFSMSLSEVVLGSSLANLTQLLPISTLGNIGTLEAGWVFGFTLLGFDSYRMLTAGIVMHVIVILAAGIYGVLSWIGLSVRSATIRR